VAFTHSKYSEGRTTREMAKIIQMLDGEEVGELANYLVRRAQCAECHNPMILLTCDNKELRIELDEREWRRIIDGEAVEDGIRLIHKDAVIPFDRTILEQVQPGDSVKLPFGRERMWVKLLECVNASTWKGRVMNYAVISETPVDYGDIVTLDLMDALDCHPASERT
jgi:hypothetical protein